LSQAQHSPGYPELIENPGQRLLIKTPPPARCKLTNPSPKLNPVKSFDV